MALLFADSMYRVKVDDVGMAPMMDGEISFPLAVVDVTQALKSGGVGTVG